MQIWTYALKALAKLKREHAKEYRKQSQMENLVLSLYAKNELKMKLCENNKLSSSYNDINGGVL